MGYKVLIFIFGFLLIIGSMIYLLSNKQLKSADEIADNLLKTQTQQIANSYAHTTLKQLNDILDSKQNYRVLNDKPKQGIIDIPNSSAEVFITHGVAHEQAYTINTHPYNGVLWVTRTDYNIVSKAEIKTYEPERTYSAQTNVILENTAVSYAPNLDIRPPGAANPLKNNITVVLNKNQVEIYEHQGNSWNSHNLNSPLPVLVYDADYIRNIGNVMIGGRYYLRCEYINPANPNAGVIPFELPLSIISDSFIYVMSDILAAPGVDLHIYANTELGAIVEKRGNTPTWGTRNVQSNIYTRGPIRGTVIQSDNHIPPRGWQISSSLQLSEWNEMVPGWKDPDPETAIELDDPNDLLNLQDIIGNTRVVKTWTELPVRVD